MKCLLEGVSIVSGPKRPAVPNAASEWSTVWSCMHEGVVIACRVTAGWPLIGMQMLVLIVGGNKDGLNSVGISVSPTCHVYWYVPAHAAQRWT